MIRHRQKMSRGVVPRSQSRKDDVTEFRRRVWAKVAPSKDAPMPDDDGIVCAVGRVVEQRDRALGDCLTLRDAADPPIARGEPWPHEGDVMSRGEAEARFALVNATRRRGRSFERWALRELLARMTVSQRGMGCDRPVTLIRADSATCPRCSKPVTHDNPRCACGECLGCHMERARA